MTASAAEYALADLAVRLGAAQVAGWSPAEQDLAVAATAAAEPEGGARRDGRDFWDLWDGRAERDGGYGSPWGAIPGCPRGSCSPP